MGDIRIIDYIVLRHIMIRQPTSAQLYAAMADAGCDNKIRDEIVGRLSGDGLITREPGDSIAVTDRGLSVFMSATRLLHEARGQ